MIVFRSIPDDPANPDTVHARELFTQYRDFLSRTQACTTFNFARYDEETATLPAMYAAHHGEVLLAFVEGEPAACIAWRDALTGPVGFLADATGRTAEIKRLFVAEAYRGKGLARRIVVEAVGRIAARQYSRVVLDTDHVHMPAANALYHSLGFRVFAPSEGNTSFLDRQL